MTGKITPALANIHNSIDKLKHPKELFSAFLNQSFVNTIDKMSGACNEAIYLVDNMTSDLNCNEILKEKSFSESISNTNDYSKDETDSENDLGDPSQDLIDFALQIDDTEFDDLLFSETS